jgi:hypothetical protein
MKQIIRLTESDLHRLVKEAVAKIMSEGKFDPKWSTKDGEAPNGNFIHDIPRNRRSNTPNSPRLKKNRNIETENTMISEEGEAGGGGATNAAGVMQGGGTNPGAGQYDVPAFAKKKQNKVGGNPFDEPIMRQKHNLGDVTKAPANQVDMKPAYDRTPGKVHNG